MGSGQAGSPDAGSGAPQDEPSAPSFGWKEDLRQRQEAAAGASGASASAAGGGSGSGSSSASGEAFWYMRPDAQSTSLNYFIPIGACWLGWSQCRSLAAALLLGVHRCTSSPACI